MTRPESSDQKEERIRRDRIKLTERYGGSSPRAAHGEVEVLLYGDIGFGGISAEMFAEELRDLGNVSHITVGINSLGGDAFDGIAMFNALVSHPARVTVRVDGIAASAASIVAMGGDRVEMSQGSTLMIHPPWTITIGDGLLHHRIGDILIDSTDNLINIYANRRGINRAKVNQLVWDESWMSAQEAVDLGFADEVISTPAIAASVPHGRFLNTPAALLGTSRWQGPSQSRRRVTSAPRWRSAFLQRERDLQLAAA